MLLYIVSSGLFFLYVLLWWRNRKLYRLSSKLKNDLWCLPLVGHAHLFLGSDEDRMKTFQTIGRMSYKTGGLTGLWLGQRFFVQVADPKTLEVVMKNCLDKDEIMSLEHDLFGNGSIFAPVPIWRPRRKVIAPTFSTKNLNQFVKVFSEQSSVMVDLIKSKAGKGTFSLWNYLTTYTMDSVCETALGFKVNAQRNPDQPFLDAFYNHCRMASFRACLPPIAQKIYKFMPVYSVYMKDIYCMWDFVDKHIETKREEVKRKIKGNDEDRQTFLELYIESSGGSSGFTDMELREETLVLLLAGTDTSAVGAAFTCLMLARHPDVQDKVYAELQEVFGDTNRQLTAADIPQLKYLEAVIKESLRLYPPAPLILRKVEKDIVIPNGLELPKDTSILINIWAVHHNPEYWGVDSEMFKPERFLEQELKHPAAFIPFSYGPRSCLGYKYAMMSMQSSVAALVRHYQLKEAGDVTVHAPLRVKFDVMMKHVDNFELQLEIRN